MGDFRDAKVMSRALRHALKAKAIETTHSEALELIAQAFGYENWNILSAKIEAAQSKRGEQRSLSATGVAVPPNAVEYTTLRGASWSIADHPRRHRQPRPAEGHRV